MKFIQSTNRGTSKTYAFIKIALLHFVAAFLLAGPLMVSAKGKSGSNVILEAMQEELARSMKKLGEKGNPAPYFIGYRITDSQKVEIASSYGALSETKNDHARYLDIDLRVGSPKLDNSHKIRGSRGGFNFSSLMPPVPITMENDRDAIKSDIWLQTDKKYKEAVEKLIKVKANKGVNVEEEDKSNDFSQEKKSVHIGESKTISPDIKAWTAKLKEYSAMFNKYPEISISGAKLKVVCENKYIVNSENSKVAEGRIHWRLSLTASSKADDGMKISRSKLFDAFTEGKLPGKEMVRKEVDKLAKEVIALRKAPLMEPYTGPAILSGSAAGVFFHEIFGHRVEGHNLKDESDSQTFAKKVGTKVLPDFVSVYDDPNLIIEGDQDLNGHYLYDDEGIKSQRVTVVENGILKGFLMSRSPIENFPNSNGHGRAEKGKKPVSRQGNLVIKASETHSFNDLRKLLIEECKKQGKQFGLYFVNVTGGFTFTGRFMPQSFNVTPVTVYRIYVDGRPDELVRGVNLVGTPLTSFSRILACSDQKGIFNGYCGAESGRVPVSCIAPDILTAQIEVEKKAKSSDKPPVLTIPDRSKPAPVPAKNEDILLRAMKDELARSMKSLKIDGMEKPYFIEYTVFDTQTVSMGGAFGALTSSDVNRKRPFKVGLRVGGYDLDNTGFVSQRGIFSTFVGGNDELVLEDDYHALRHDMWLATDNAYKSALETLASKKAYLKNQAKTEPIPDFSREKKVEKVLPTVTFKVKKGKWEQVVRNLSALFKKYPAIYKSGVQLEMVMTNKYYVNSEGTAYRSPESLVTLSAHGMGQAIDGQRVKHFVPFVARRPGDLPSENEMAAAIRKMADELTGLIAAPVMDSYQGPVIFTGQASVELFSQLMVPHFSGKRPPISENSRFSMMNSESKLAGKIGRKVLPSFMSVTDDPTVTAFNKQPLLGGYAIDSEGVLPQPVKLVEKGKLKTLLMGRRPRKDIANSNGHARSGIMGKGGVLIGNLTVSSDDPVPVKELKEQMVEFCKDQGLEYGLMVKTFDNSSITGKEFDVQSIFASITGGSTGASLESPVLVYKIYVKDRREELVRGMQIGDLDLGDMRKIEAAGNDPFVYHKVMSGGNAVVGLAMSFTGGRGLSLMGIPVSIVAPSILFEEIEFKKHSGKKKKAPLFKHPYFSK